MTDRRTFLSHFIICLAIAAGAYFAYRAGIPQLVMANEVARWFGGAIGIMFLWTAVWLGWQCWLADGPRPMTGLFGERRSYADASFGRQIKILCPAIGMLGTVVGLGIAFKNAGTAEMFAGASTAFMSTGCGIVGMILTIVLTYNLQQGIARTRR